jgi:hypothetical protein
MLSTSTMLVSEDLNHACQNYNASQILMFDEYIKVRQSLYTYVIIWVNTILKHNDAKTISPNYEGSCMVYKPKWY